jgi:hypothetical protein
VFVVATVWSGGHIGEGTAIIVRRAISERGQPPKVRWLSNDEVALAGYDKPTVEIGPITPDHPGGGTSLAVLKDRAATGKAEFYYELIGPDFPAGAKFALVGDNSDRALHYTVRLQRTGDGT